MKDSVHGAGGVAKAPAAGSLQHGCDGMTGSRSPAQLDDGKSAIPSA